MNHGELSDVPIHHPLRCHREEGEGIIHHYPQQRQHVRMTKSLPSHNLLAEHLWREELASGRDPYGGFSELAFVIFPKLLDA